MLRIITHYRFGTAKQYESNNIDDLSMHEMKLVMAVSVYAKEERRRELRACGVILA